MTDPRMQQRLAQIYADLERDTMNSEPQIGDYGVVNMTGPMGWLIRAVTRSRVAHAFVYVGDGRIVEAMPGGARIAPLNSRPGAYFNTDDPIWQQAADANGITVDEQREAVAQAAVDTTRGHPGPCDGIPYGFRCLISVGALQYGIKPPRIRRAVADSSEQICSQLVDQANLNAYLPFERDVPVHLYDDGRLPMDVTPGDLDKRITAYRKATA